MPPSDFVATVAAISRLETLQGSPLRSANLSNSFRVRPILMRPPIMPMVAGTQPVRLTTSSRAIGTFKLYGNGSPCDTRAVSSATTGLLVARASSTSGWMSRGALRDRTEASWAHVELKRRLRERFKREDKRSIDVALTNHTSCATYVPPARSFRQ